MPSLPLSKSSPPELNSSKAQNHIDIREAELTYYRERCKALKRQLLATEEEKQLCAEFAEKCSRRCLKLQQKLQKRQKNDAKRLKRHEKEGALTSNDHLTISEQNPSSGSDKADKNSDSPARESIQNDQSNNHNNST